MDADVYDKNRLNKSIERQIELNLPVSVLKQGEWGSYRNLSMEYHRELGGDGSRTNVLSSLADLR
jgi:hypothetical protein